MSDEKIRELREVFVRLLTVDGDTPDRRRKGYNQAIFFPAEDSWASGRPVFDGTDLDMVLDKFDRAVKEMGRV